MMRDPSRLPLIEVQFNLERLARNANFGALAVSVDSCPKRHVNFDLFLNIVETPEGLTFSIATTIRAFSTKLHSALAAVL